MRRLPSTIALAISLSILDLDQHIPRVALLNDVMGAQSKTIFDETPNGFGHPFKTMEKKLDGLVLHHHLSHWHPITTAPCNQILEIRVIDSNKLMTLPFPCKRNNYGDWINVDLDTRVSVKPARWRVWQKTRSGLGSETMKMLGTCNQGQ
jgi:hypothetical protein